MRERYIGWRYPTVDEESPDARVQSKGLEVIVYVEEWLAVADVQWQQCSTGRQDEIDKVSDVSRELIEMVGDVFERLSEASTK